MGISKKALGWFGVGNSFLALLAFAGPLNASAMQSSHAFGSAAINPVGQDFTVEFDTVPNQAPIDALTGLSNGSTNSFGDLAAIIRFNPSGNFDVRNGGNYSADQVLHY